MTETINDTTTATECSQTDSTVALPGPKPGRALVRELLTGPLSALRRPRGVSAAVHEAALEKLTSKLAYLGPQALAGLTEVALRHAGTTAVPTCPDPAIVLAWAYALQCPPPRDSDYAASLIRSALGRQAMDEGWVVPLLRIARRLGPPPGRYSILQLKDQAEDDRRRRREIAGLIDSGEAGSESRAWLDRWHRDLAECEALLGGDPDSDAAAPVFQSRRSA
jgi:hypothetical protein